MSSRAAAPQSVIQVPQPAQSTPERVIPGFGGDAGQAPAPVDAPATEPDN
jgi:hypothetical protein